MNKSNPKIIVVLGPTASGKSDAAIRLARKFNGEIISADSRQVYRGMDLGTGKVTKREQRLAKHWMLDIINPNTPYNSAKFKKAADRIIRDIIRRGKVPIICGGTGFWIKALVDDATFPEVKPDWKLRQKIGKRSALELALELKKLDPKRWRAIDRNNKVRLIRAIEIARALGRVPENESSPRYNSLQLGIKLPKKILQNRIKARLKKRFRQGMIAEVEKIHRQGVSWNRLESFGLEYRRIAEYLQKKITRAEMEEKLYFDIIHYAKRQMTWFQKDRRIKWLGSHPSIEKATKSFLKK